MKVAFIPPFDAMEEYITQPLHLHLPQLANQNYRSHFNRIYQSHRRHVIMDNGAAELAPMTIDELVKAVREKNPGEVAIPDVMGDAVATFDLAMAWFKSWDHHIPFSEVDTKLGYVVQGTTGPEAFDWLAHFMATDNGRFIDVVYLPRLLVGWENSSQFERIWLADEIHEHWPDVIIHLFGAASSFPEEVLLATQVPHIRSIDTSLPWQLALVGERLRVMGQTHHLVSRPPDFFTRKWSPRELKLAEDNVKIYREWANA